MLQQTTVAAVLPYFERWMARFPTVETLAAANEQEVLSHWQGLGYYSRARNLHAAAGALAARGSFPDTAEGLRSLPGVGEYTAAAVGAFAFDRAEPVIDANIARVLARLDNWARPVDDAAGKAFLREAAIRLLPASGGRLHNSALMELGALICVPRNPRCADCPVRSECRAEDPSRLPVKRARPAIETREDNRAFVIERGRLWLELSVGPLWKGLWLLPSAVPNGTEPLYRETYPVTRFRISLCVFTGRRSRGQTGFPLGDLPPMPSPHRRAVAALLGNVHTS